MQVHVVQYSYRDADYEGNDVIGVYADKEKARRSMKDHMDEMYARVSEYYGYGDEEFSEDFKIDWPDAIHFGFYGCGFEGDHVWACCIETMELE